MHTCSLLRATGSSKQAKHAIVVGGGWAGFGAAYALLRAGVKVTILDASQTPGGLSAGWRTAGGRSIEAGIKGYSMSLPLHNHCLSHKMLIAQELHLNANSYCLCIVQNGKSNAGV